MTPARPAVSAGGATPPEKPGDARSSPLPMPLASASALVAAAVQAERRRIAQALHDTVSQTLTGTYLQAYVIVRRLEASGSEAADDMAHLTEAIYRAVVELQEVARGLQPEAESSAD